MSDTVEINVEAFDVRVITLGLGEFVAGTYIRAGMPSLCFGPAPEPRQPGEQPTLEVAEYATRNGAVVISFANIAAMERMLDLIKEAADQAQEYHLDGKSEGPAQ